MVLINSGTIFVASDHVNWSSRYSLGIFLETFWYHNVAYYETEVEQLQAIDSQKRIRRYPHAPSCLSAL